MVPCTPLLINNKVDLLVRHGLMEESVPLNLHKFSQQGVGFFLLPDHSLHGKSESLVQLDHLLLRLQWQLISCSEALPIFSFWFLGMWDHQT